MNLSSIKPIFIIFSNSKLNGSTLTQNIQTFEKDLISKLNIFLKAFFPIYVLCLFTSIIIKCSSNVNFFIIFKIIDFYYKIQIIIYYLNK